MKALVAALLLVAACAPQTRIIRVVEYRDNPADAQKINELAERLGKCGAEIMRMKEKRELQPRIIFLDLDEIRNTEENDEGSNQTD